MENIIQQFYVRYATGLAVEVANFLSPIPPSQDPGRLYDIQRTTNEIRVIGDVQNAIQSQRQLEEIMSSDEKQGWADIISCYWRAVDRIVKAEQAQIQGKLSERQSLEVYDAWKDLTSSFTKNISNGSLPHWTIFTLCLTANHLRKFAIKADEQMSKAKPVAFNAGFQDDIVGAAPRNEKLEEAARVFNRIFALCLGDRTPDMMQSRKWGVYCVANLQFKTYFKVNAN
jgi:hypothetical protein